MLLCRLSSPESQRFKWEMLISTVNALKIVGFLKDPHVRNIFCCDRVVFVVILSLC